MSQVRGHDRAVIASYSSFIREVADRLEVACDIPAVPPFHRRHERRPYTWLQTNLKSAHVHKKHKVQYETRTHWQIYTFSHMTGRTEYWIVEQHFHSFQAARPTRFSNTSNDNCPKASA